MLVTTEFASPNLTGATVAVEDLDGNVVVTAVAAEHISNAPEEALTYGAEITLPDGFVQGKLVWNDGLGRAGSVFREMLPILQSIIDHGDNAWATTNVGFNGQHSFTLTFVDADLQPVPAVRFTIAGQGSATTDENGSFTGGLDNGSYIVVAAPKNGALFPDTPFVVNGAAVEVEVRGSADQLPDASDPAKRVIRVELGKFAALQNLDVSALEVRAQLIFVKNGIEQRVSGVGGTNFFLPTEVIETASGGIADFELTPTSAITAPQGCAAKYRFSVNSIELKTVSFGSGSSTYLALL